jgi:hypothetical protein
VTQLVVLGHIFDGLCHTWGSRAYLLRRVNFKSRNNILECGRGAPCISSILYLTTNLTYLLRKLLHRSCKQLCGIMDEPLTRWLQVIIYILLGINKVFRYVGCTLREIIRIWLFEKNALSIGYNLFLYSVRRSHGGIVARVSWLSGGPRFESCCCLTSPRCKGVPTCNS